MVELEVRLAGAVNLRRGDREFGDAAVRGRQLRLVTAMLLCERRHSISVEWLAGEVWPGGLPDRWRPALRGLVSKVRRMLVDLGLGVECITSVGGAWRVDPGPVSVDVEDALAWADGAVGALADDRLEEARDLANRARTVLSRPVLPGVDSAWLDGVRDRAGDRLVDVLVVLGTCRSRLGRHVEARTVLAEAVDTAPLREDVWRALMRTEVQAGNASGALHAYERVRANLVTQLGVDPSAETQQLHMEVLDAIPEPASDRVVERTVGSPDSETIDGPPYVGLRAFHRGDAGVFFGRSAEVQELVERLARHRIVALVGPSGVGKSSLVRAGLLPALERGAIPDSDTWLPVVVVPGSTPMKAVSAALADLSDEVAEDEVQDALLAGGSDGLHGVTKRLLDEDPDARLLLVIDQLEEVFTLGDDSQAEALVAQLADATRRLDGRLVAVVTLRADFFDAAARVTGMADLLSRAQYVVPPLGGEQLEEVVVGPARRARLDLEPGLSARIVTDMAGQPGALPLLQHLLYELWEHRVGRALTRGAYTDLGGVAGALANRAEAVYGELDRDERGVARRLLLRAVQPGDDGADARRPVRASEWVDSGGDHDRVESVIARLVDNRLLTAGADSSTDERVVELAHEALIDGWPRLRAWVDEARGWLLDHRRVTVAAEEWSRHHRHDDWLLAGLPLDEANELLLADGRGDVDLHLTPLEHNFVAASLAAREADRERDARRRERERQLERRSLRRLQALVGLVLLVALVIGTLWWSDRQQARIAQAGELAAASGEALATDPQLALLLGLEAADRVGSGQAPIHHEIATALHAAIGANRLVNESTDVPAPMDMSTDRSLLVARRIAQEPDGSWGVEVRDVQTRDLLAELTGLGGPGSIRDAKFDGSGDRVVIDATDGVVTVWDWRTGQTWRMTDPDHVSASGWVDLSADGRHVVLTPNGDDVIEVWAVDDEHRLHAFEASPGPDRKSPWPPYGHFHPRDPLVALPFSNRQEVRVHHVETGEQVWQATVPGVSWAAWSPDGRWLAVAGDRFVLLDAETGAQVADIDRTGEPSPIQWSLDSRRVSIGTSPHNPEPGRIWTVVDDDGPIAAPDAPIVLQAEPLSCAMAWFGPDSTVWELSACGSGIRTWDIDARTGGEVAWLPGDGKALSPLAFSPDGATLTASGQDGRLVRYATDTWDTTIAVVAHEPAGVVDLDYDDDGGVLASRGLDGAALWDTTTWEPVLRHEAENWGRVAVSPDGQHVAHSAATETGDSLVVADRRGVEVANRSFERGLEIRNLDFGPDGDVLAAAVSATAGDSDANHTLVWNWLDDRVVATIRTPLETRVVDLAESGSTMLTSSGPPANTVQIWDLAAIADQTVDATDSQTAPGRMILEGHQQHVYDAVLSSDERLVATCSRDTTTRLWDAQTGRELQRLTNDLGDGCQVAFDPSGDLVAVSDPANGIRIFAVPLADVATIAQERLVRDWTHATCREYLDPESCPT